TAYALNNIQERGRLFIGPQEHVYEGMIVGENARPEDLPVNPCKAKHLTNMRSQGEGKGIQLEAPLCMSLERAIEYIDIDEYVEATPKSLRLRKRTLDATARKRAIVIAAQFSSATQGRARPPGAPRTCTSEQTCTRTTTLP